MGHEQEFRVDNHHTNRKRQLPKRKDITGVHKHIIELRHAITQSHEIVDHHRVRRGHEVPPRVLAQVECAVDLAAAVELGNGEESRGLQVLLEHAKEDDAEGAEDHVDYGPGPVLVQGGAGEAVVALIDCLGEEEHHFFPGEDY